MDKFSFSRFNEKRNYKSRDTTGYDEYVEGVEPEETMSLETHIGESLSCSPPEQHGVQVGPEDGMEERDRSWERWTRSS
jgi:hypothetical protein